MKKLIIISASLTLFAAFFISCNNEEKPPESVAINPVAEDLPKEKADPFAAESQSC